MPAPLKRLRCWHWVKKAYAAARTPPVYFVGSIGLRTDKRTWSGSIGHYGKRWKHPRHRLMMEKKGPQKQGRMLLMLVERGASQIICFRAFDIFWTAIALMTCPGLPAGAFFIHGLTMLPDGAPNTTLVGNAQGHPMP